MAPTPLATPLILPQGIWLLGIIWFSIHFTLYLIQLVVLIIRKNIANFCRITAWIRIERKRDRS